MLELLEETNWRLVVVKNVLPVYATVLLLWTLLTLRHEAVVAVLAGYRNYPAPFPWLELIAVIVATMPLIAYVLVPWPDSWVEAFEERLVGWIEAGEDNEDE